MKECADGGRTSVLILANLASNAKSLKIVLAKNCYCKIVLANT